MGANYRKITNTAIALVLRKSTECLGPICPVAAPSRCRWLIP